LYEAALRKVETLGVNTSLKGEAREAKEVEENLGKFLKVFQQEYGAIHPVAGGLDKDIRDL
jgi:hypothetical protein